MGFTLARCCVEQYQEKQTGEAGAVLTLAQQRQLFSRLLGELLVWAENNRPTYAIAINEVVRTQAQANANAASGAGISHSLHLLGLAADLLLYIDNVYREDTDSYRDLGNKWKSLHPLNCWGGDFSKPDADHFSSTRDGIR